MKEFDGFSKKRIKIQRFVVIFKLYVIISMAVAFISGAYLLTTFMPDKLTNKQTLLVLITSISISIASVSAIIIAFINARSQLQRENKSFENKLIFLELFKVFERNSKDILFKKNAKYNSLSYRSLINELFERNL
ncbi:TPA: hypothetical protein QH442_002277, partial [Morganella morganii subsp. morganii]|nr:hypothetical protein [Morganella morganii subsp. morganii]